MVNTHSMVLLNYSHIIKIWTATLNTLTLESAAAKEQFDDLVRQLQDGKFDSEIGVADPTTTMIVAIGIEKIRFGKSPTETKVS